ncbi:MAG: filamentous hemagglutinin N-terminal domain-containing protein [Nitrosomonadales bacterium]|nr:filamentous hemagglutinin N-terminal domain-containing protein [Nitrosomonadales bacterium]
MNSEKDFTSKAASGKTKPTSWVVKLSGGRKLYYTLRRRRVVSSLVAALLTAFMGHTYALPTGGSVAAGSATISQTAQTMQIDQASQRAVLNWQGFSIATGELVNINQPGVTSVMLNRVLGSDPSSIFGSLTANGQVFLVNPSGVLFAPGANVNVGGLVATTLNISDADLMAGNNVFVNGGNAGSVVNQGAINAGYAALLAPQVSNQGAIVARMGTVALAAGDRVSLDLVGDGLISVAVDGAAVNASIANSGLIQADGGNVFLTARSANALLDTVVNMDGVIKANTLSNQNGTIVLDGGNAGVVSVSGTLDASGAGAGQTGGTIQVLGDHIQLTGATIDASGDAGGGTVLVGGDFQGKGAVATAAFTTVDQNTTIAANANTTGDGGKVIVWADDTTRYSGAISARGGANAGDGGFVEVSGKGVLAFNGTADRRAPHGSAGTLLLDPTDLQIITPGVDSAEFAGCSTVSCGATTEAVSTLTDATLALALLGGPVNVNAIAGTGLGGGTINWTAAATVDASANSLTLTGTSITFDGTLTNVANLIFSTAPTGTGTATTSTGGSITGLGATTFNITGATTGTAGGITFNNFTAADTTAVTGAVGFDDAAQSNQGITFASAATVSGTGAIANVNGSFADDTLTSTASTIVYTGFNAVSGAGTALTTVNGSFDDTNLISTASGVNYTGFALGTVAGTGTALTGVATSFNDGTKVSGSLINYSGLAGLATVAGDGTADVANSADFAIGGLNTGTGTSGIIYSAFDTASNTTAVTGAVGFDDAAQSNQGITFASAATVSGTGAIANVNGSFADDTLTSTASTIVYTGFNAVSGAGTALTGMNGSFDDTSLISTASGVNYTGFALGTVAGTGTALTGVATSFNDGTKVSGSLINYSGLAGLATVAGDGTADVANSADFAIGGLNTGTGTSGIIYSAFDTASNTTAVTGAVGFDDAAQSNQGITFASAATVSGTGAIANVNGSFADDTLTSTASTIVYTGFNAVSGAGTALTGMNGSFDDTSLISTASGVNYTGFALGTVSVRAPR